jgi:hypothetical protein
MDDHRKPLDRRAEGFKNLCFRFFLEYTEAISFIAGWSAYPIGLALLALLGR